MKRWHLVDGRDAFVEVRDPLLREDLLFLAPNWAWSCADSGMIDCSILST